MSISVFRMRRSGSNWGEPGRQRRYFRVAIEQLEVRRVLAGSGDLVGDTFNKAVDIPASADIWVVRSESINAQTDVDLYKIHVDAGDTLIAFLDQPARQTAFAARLILFYRDGIDFERLLSTDDFALHPGLQYKISRGGDYFLGVSDGANDDYDPTFEQAPLGVKVGDYAVHVLVHPDRTPDQNNNIESAEPINLVSQGTRSATIHRDLRSVGDIDLYSFQANAGDLIGIDVRFSQYAQFTMVQGGQPFLSPFIRVFDSEGHELARNFSQGASDPAARVYAEYSGVFYVGISDLLTNASYDPQEFANDELDPSAFGYYEIDFQLQSVQRDKNDTLSTAIPWLTNFPAPAQVTGRIEYARDVDMYSVPLDEGQILTIEVEPATTRDMLRSDVRIFDAFGSELAFENTDFSGNVRGQFFVPLTGTYLIAVSESSNVRYSPFSELSGRSGLGTFEKSNTFGDYRLKLAAAGAAVDLSASFIGVSEQLVAWEDSISLSLVIDNLGVDDAPSTSAQLFASGIGPHGGALALGEISVPEIAAGETYQRTLMFVLPANIELAGEDTILHLYLVVDQLNTIAELDETNNSSPVHDLHVVRASGTSRIQLNDKQDGFMASGIPARYALLVTTSGRMQIDIQATAGSGLDPRVELRQVSGQLLAASDDRNPQDRSATLTQFLSAGLYLIDVSSSGTGGTGSFEIQTHFQAGTLPYQGVVDDRLSAVRIPVEFAQLPIDGIGRIVSVAANEMKDLIVVIPTDGQLRITAFSIGLNTRPQFSLFDANGFLLATSNAGNFFIESNLTQFVHAGVLHVVINSGTDTNIQIAAEFGSASSQRPAVVKGNFNDDSFTDLIVEDFVSGDLVLYAGQADGSLVRKSVVYSGREPIASLVVAKFNGDQIDDLIIGQQSPVIGGENSLLFLPGRSDGSFGDPRVLETASDFLLSVCAGDFDEDGLTDLALIRSKFLDGQVAVLPAAELTILRGAGDGTAEAIQHYLISPGSRGLQTGDFNRDGHMDLVAFSNFSRNISLLLGTGNSTFADPQESVPDQPPSDIAVADFNGDSFDDLVVASESTDQLMFYFGKTFVNFSFPNTSVSAGMRTALMVVGDFNHDGLSDLATYSKGLNGGQLLLGSSEAMLGEALLTQSSRFVAPAPVLAILTDSNGNLDVVSTDPNRVAVLANPFRSAENLPQGVAQSSFPALSALSVDLNNDGRSDLVRCNFSRNTVSIFIADSNGNLQLVNQLAVGTHPQAIAAGDFNGDNRQDLAVVHEGSRDVRVYFGIGKGSFISNAESIYVLTSDPTTIAVLNDVNGDRIPDLVVGTETTVVGIGSSAPTTDPSIVILLSNRRSVGVVSFVAQPAIPIEIGDRNRSGNPIESQVDVSKIAVVDFDSQGALDLAVIGTNSNPLSPNFGEPVATVLIGNGSQSVFNPGQANFSLYGSFDIEAGDFDRNGLTDVALATPHAVQVLFGNAKGEFLPRADIPSLYTLGINTTADLLVADFDHDGILDFATANADTSDVTIYRGLHEGSFQYGATFALSNSPQIMQGGDFNDDGLLDIAVFSAASDSPDILINDGSTRIFADGRLAATFSQTEVVRGRLNNDRWIDTATINAQGEILVRLGRENGSFDPPLTLRLNGTTAHARLIAALETGSVANPQSFLAALDNSGTMIAIYGLRTPTKKNSDSARLIARIQDFPLHSEVADLTTSDLDGDGLADDLAVLMSDAEQVAIYYDAAGDRLLGTQLTVAPDSTEVACADVNRDGLLDVMVTAPRSGSFELFLNQDHRLFSTRQRYWAGESLHSLTATAERFLMISAEGTSSLAAGDLLNRQSNPFLVVANSNTRSVSILLGKSTGGLVDPSSMALGFSPFQVVVGNFFESEIERSSGARFADLAFLDQANGRIVIYAGDGSGNFTIASSNTAVGEGASGMKVVRLNGDEIDDLMVTNSFGDILQLIGRPTGKFDSGKRIDQKIALTVEDLDGDGQKDFIAASSQIDRIQVLDGRAKNSVDILQDGLLAPAAIKTVKVGSKTYLVVANSQANEIRIYRRRPNGKFTLWKDPIKVGTEPVAFAVGNLDEDKDGMPDIAVANKGSNDVSVLLGQKDSDGNWTLLPGQRLAAGDGPVDVAITNTVGKNPKLVVANQAANTLTTLPGVGGGLFNDQNPITQAFQNPIRVLPVGGSSFVAIGSLGSSLFTTTARPRTISVNQAERFTAVAEFQDGEQLGLVLANSDGLVSFLLGDDGGFELLGQITVDRPPIDLAVLKEGNAFKVYSAIENRDFPLLLFTFGGEDVSNLVVSTATSTLSDISIPIVATLVETVSVSPLTMEFGTLALDALFTGLVTGGSSLDDPQETGSSPAAPVEPSNNETVAPAQELQEFITGIPEAIQKISEIVREQAVDLRISPKDNGSQPDTNSDRLPDAAESAPANRAHTGDTVRALSIWDDFFSALETKSDSEMLRTSIFEYSQLRENNSNPETSHLVTKTTNHESFESMNHSSTTWKSRFVSFQLQFTAAPFVLTSPPKRSEPYRRGAYRRTRSSR